MFFNKGFSEEAINLHDRLDCLLFVMLCIFFWADSNSHSKIAIILEILLSFAIFFAFIDA